MREWHYHSTEGKQVGPYPETEFISFFVNGQLRPETLVWTEGLAQWTPANEIEGLVPNLSQQPRLAVLPAHSRAPQARRPVMAPIYLYKPFTASVLAFFFTPLLGACLISSNWKKLREPKQAFRSMLFFYVYLGFLLASFILPPSYLISGILFLNLIGLWLNAYCQSKFLWKKQIHYVREPIGTSVLYGIVILWIIIPLSYYSQKDHFDQAFAEMKVVMNETQKQRLTPTDLEKLKQLASEDITKLDSETTDSDGFSKKTDLQFELIKSPKNKAEEMTNVLRSRFNDIINISNEYVTGLESIGWESLMDPQRIQTPNSYQQTEKIIASGINLATENKRKQIASYERCISAIEKLAGTGLDQEAKTKTEKNMKLLIDASDIEIEIAGKIGELVKHLHECSERWEFKDEAYFFDEETDEEKFTSIYSEFEAMSEKQDELNELLEEVMKSD
tara:strand:+ start:92 stop:1435 length:1344 start_codon:yes stop_codon:yes gene_type:complete